MHIVRLAIRNLWLVSVGLVVGKLYTFQLFGPAGHNTKTVFWFAARSLVGGLVVLYVCVPQFILPWLIPLAIGYVLSLVILSRMLKAERQEYLRTGGEDIGDNRGTSWIVVLALQVTLIGATSWLFCRFAAMDTSVLYIGQLGLIAAVAWSNGRGPEKVAYFLMGAVVAVAFGPTWVILRPL